MWSEHGVNGEAVAFIWWRENSIWRCDSEAHRQTLQVPISKDTHFLIPVSVSQTFFWVSFVVTNEPPNDFELLMSLRPRV